MFNIFLNLKIQAIEQINFNNSKPHIFPGQGKHEKYESKKDF